MKIVFFGTPPFAAKILEYLTEKKMEIVAVVCQPDRQRENRSPIVPAVKKMAQRLLPGVSILQPEKASEAIFLDTLEAFQADLFVIVAYGQILKKRLLQMPKVDCINVHGSLLPKYRGAAPIQRAIMNGEKLTGITIMKVVAKMDAGEMIRKETVEITPQMTFGELEKALCHVSGPLLLSVIQDLETGTVTYEKQDEELVSFAPKIEASDCEIDWESNTKNAQSVHDQIRGLSPRPGAYTYFLIDGEKRRVKILLTKVVDHEVDVKEIFILSKNQMLVGFQENSIEILELQVEGKKAMQVIDFLRGLKNQKSLCLYLQK